MLRSSVTVASLGAEDRCPLHRRPRIHIGIGHHRPPSHIDHQGAPGSRIHRLSCHAPPFCRGRNPQRYPAHPRDRAARKGPASFRRHPADHHCPARGPDRTPNSAIVLVGFAGGFWRSERAGIHICDLKFSSDSVVVSVRKSKTDQEGAGRDVGLPFGSSPDTYPVRALRQWLDRAGISDGPVFRAVGRYGHVAQRGLHKDSIGMLLKRAAARAGMNVNPLGGHSSAPDASRRRR